MATIQKFEELDIWQLARIIYQKVPVIAVRMRKAHDYRFADLIKAAAGSVMDHIAEGFERNSRLEFLNALSISKGECGELKSQAYRCLDDKYINDKDFNALYDDIDVIIKKISTFIIYLNKSTIKGLKFKDRGAAT
jgi:four helix bundle protein